MRYTESLDIVETTGHGGSDEQAGHEGKSRVLFKRVALDKFSFYGVFIVGIIWFCHLLAWIVALTILKKKVVIPETLDGCTRATAYHSYMIGVKFLPPSTKFRLEKVTISVDLIDKFHIFVTRLALSPEWLVQNSSKLKKKKHFKMVKFIVHRQHVIPELGWVRLSHDSYNDNYIFIDSVSVRDLTGGGEKNAYFKISQDIFALPPHHSEDENVYPVAEGRRIPPEEELAGEGISTRLSYIELVLFAFLHFNTTAFFTLLLPKGPNKIYMTEAIQGALFTFLISTISTSFIMIIFIWLIKSKYAATHGFGSWAAIRFLYLFLIFIVGLIGGGLAATMAGFKLTTTEIVGYQFWAIALSIAVLMSILFWIVIASVFILAKKLTDPSETRDRKIDSMIDIKSMKASRESLGDNSESRSDKPMRVFVKTFVSDVETSKSSKTDK